MTDPFLFRFLSNRLRLNGLVCQEYIAPIEASGVFCLPLAPRIGGAEAAYEKVLLLSGYHRLGFMDTHAEPQGR